MVCYTSVHQPLILATISIIAKNNLIDSINCFDVHFSSFYNTFLKNFVANLAQAIDFIAIFILQFSILLIQTKKQCFLKVNVSIYLFAAAIELNVLLFAFIIASICNFISMLILLITSRRLNLKALPARLVFLCLAATVKITSFILKKNPILAG